MLYINEYDLEKLGFDDISEDSLGKLNEFIDRNFQNRYKHMIDEKERYSCVSQKEASIAKKNEDELREIVTDLIEKTKRHPNIYSEIKADQGLNKRLKRQEIKYK